MSNLIQQLDDAARRGLYPAPDMIPKSLEYLAAREMEALTAENAALKEKFKYHHKPYGCKCDYRTYALGDGCEVCNPAKALEYAQGTIEDLRQRMKELEAVNSAWESGIERRHIQIARMSDQLTASRAENARMAEAVKTALELAFVDANDTAQVAAFAKLQAALGSSTALTWLTANYIPRSEVEAMQQEAVEKASRWHSVKTTPTSGQFLLAVWEGSWKNPREHWRVYHATGFREGPAWAMKGQYRTEEGGAYSLAGWKALPSPPASKEP